MIANEEGTKQAAIRAMGQLKQTATIEEIEQRAERCLLEFVSFGATLIRSHVDVDATIGIRGMEALVRLRDRHRHRVTLQLVPFTSGALDSLNRSERTALLRDAVAMGADAVGEAPASAGDPEARIDTVFQVATEFDLPVDLHVDETDDPNVLTLEKVADKTISEGYEGRVIAGHCCSLAAVEDSVARRVIDKVAKAQISIITLPICNLYLQGRHDPPPIRRGITRVKEFLEAGVNIFCATDSVQDVFSPYGRADPLDAAWLTGLAAQLDSRYLPSLLDMVTFRPAQALSFAGQYGIDEGLPANLVVLDCDSPDNLVVERPPRWLVLKQGRIVSSGSGAHRLDPEEPAP